MTYWKTIRRKLTNGKVPKTNLSKIKLIIFILAFLGASFMLLGIVIEMWLVGMAWKYM